MTASIPVRLAFVLYIVVEVALFVLVGQWLGGGALFLWVLATAAVGAVLIRREGMRAVETMRVAMRERRAPDRTVPDRGIVAAGGLLLLLPGILTDLVGLIMVIPASRPFARRLLTMLGTGLVSRAGGVTSVRPPPMPAPKPTSGPIIRGEVLDSRDDPAN
jgi:UPF0716 protein FxsA